MASNRTQRLGTVLGLLDGTKKKSHAAVSGLYALVQKRGLFDGHRRVYAPLTENADGTAERLPTEEQKVQYVGEQLLAHVAGAYTRLFDLELTMDTADTTAFADLIIATTSGSVVLVERVPATTLLFLRKKLVDLRTFVSKLPTHDREFDWEQTGDEAGVYRSQPIQTVRTKKVRVHKIVVAPTEHHPAQTDSWQEDQPTGTWTLIKFTGALPHARYVELLTRVDFLIEAVERALEQTKQVDAPDLKMGDKLFKFVIDGTV